MQEAEDRRKRLKAMRDDIEKADTTDAGNTVAIAGAFSACSICDGQLISRSSADRKSTDDQSFARCNRFSALDPVIHIL